MVSGPINRFLEILRAGPKDRRCVFNPWSDHDERDRAPRREMPALRAANMAAYLEARRRSARVMLLGEAPSHRGCRFTGIAFCSEVELVHKAGLVGRERMPLTSVDGATKPVRERSAAIIWDELERAGCSREVILWNAFPWHPYRAPADAGDATVGPCGPSSNRKPRRTEVEQGRPALAAMLACFTHPLDIYAVGKVAEEALGGWEEARCTGYIRHPAQGGESRFRAQFRALVASRF